MSRSRIVVLLLIALLALPLLAFAQDEIAFGETVEGNLTADEPTAIYTFTAEQDQSVTIRLVSSDFDCFLTLQNADGDVLATDDDSAGNLDSQITFRIPDAGEYTILAQSYASSQGTGVEPGAFTLALQSSSFEYGMTVNGDLTEAETFDDYSFQGDAGDTILITMIGDDGLDTYLTLYQGVDKSVSLLTNDDGAGGLNSLIGPYTLPADGVYTVEATSFSRTAAGTYTLTLERAEVSTLEYGDSVEASLTENRQFLYYQFEGTEGDIIDLKVEDGATIGTSLVVNGPDGYQVGYSDSYSGADPLVNDLQLTATGTYTVLVRTLEPNTAGKITVVLEQATLESLDEGPLMLEFSDAVTRNTMVFTGNEDEAVTLTLTVQDGESGSPSVSVTQNGSSITYISASTVTELSVSFVVPGDGDVLVQIDDYGYVTHTIEVTLDKKSS
ncbi:MAG: pre-peptidase C-terminal domain-containing protein [Anaerolineae bacterium]|nr:pre-peptidase C-terminal domain-containing protein [Anaerolineae bacterium]